MNPIFESERDGVRLYDNRIEVDKKGLFGTSTKTYYLHDIAGTLYAGGSSVGIVTAIRSCPEVEFRKKQTARAFLDALNTIIPPSF